jgi:D-aminoacyl-tRNA deacylase
MRAIVQRILRGSVETESNKAAAIDSGLLVYLGVDVEDAIEDARQLANKVRYLRIFQDQGGKMNLDVGQAGGAVLVVSAFTLLADARKGRRPTFDSAAHGDTALHLYEAFCDSPDFADLTVVRGVFGSHMHVDCVNDGPVCILLDSRRII